MTTPAANTPDAEHFTYLGNIAINDLGGLTQLVNKLVAAELRTIGHHPALPQPAWRWLLDRADELDPPGRLPNAHPTLSEHADDCDGCEKPGAIHCTAQETGRNVQDWRDRSLDTAPPTSPPNYPGAQDKCRLCSHSHWRHHDRECTEHQACPCNGQFAEIDDRNAEDIDRATELDGLEKHLATELTKRGFLGWLLSNGNSPLWKERTPEQEIARVVVALLDQNPTAVAAATGRCGSSRVVGEAGS